MDSIPWEKAQLAAEEKPHCVLEKKPSGQRFKEHRAGRWIGKDEKDSFFFIEGAGDRFLLS
ncbi:MAG: hypothetical protein ACI3YI_05070, partial [Bacteroidaceae bacterium]